MVDITPLLLVGQLEVAVEALASGNAALVDVSAAQASGNAGISLALAEQGALASGNAALVNAATALASGNAVSLMLRLLLLLVTQPSRMSQVNTTRQAVQLPAQ